MSINTVTILPPDTFPPKIAGNEEIYYPDTDDSIMPEGIQHFLLSVRLVSTLLAFFADRSDVKVFGNCMLYFEPNDIKKVISPDVMICFGLNEMPHRVYKLWETKVVPSVVIEFASETTWLNDVSSKLALYQKLGVAEYYVYDVEHNTLPESLLAYRLIDGVLTQMQFENKRIFSESLDLELVDTNETLRVFDTKSQRYLMTMEEMMQRLTELEKQNDGK